MRFFKLPGLVHMLVLAALMAAALPFAGMDAPGPLTMQEADAAAAPMNCETEGGAGCPGMTLHCLVLVIPEPGRQDAMRIATDLRQRPVAVSAPSRMPRAETPPPRA